jgi:hypothetical protein
LTENRLRVLYYSGHKITINKLFDLWFPPPLDNWNIVESGVKHYNPNL